MIISISGFSQKTRHGVKSTGNLFMDFGVKGMYGSSLFVNTNLFNDANYNHGFAGSYGVGGKVALDFGEHVAIVAEGIYTSMGQKFSIKDPVLGDWTKSLQLKSFNIPILLRKNNPETGSYAEIGPQISLLTGVKENTFSGNPNTVSTFNTNYWSMVFGFGGYLWGTDNFGISSGLRFVYALQDIVNPSVGDLHTYNNAVFSYADYQKTNPLSVFFVLEANYDLGFIIAKNECTGRRKFLFYN